MFAYQECGRKFRTVKAAEKAAFGDSGCPGCGGSDIDLDMSPAPVKAAARVRPAKPDPFAGVQFAPPWPDEPHHHD